MIIIVDILIVIALSLFAAYGAKRGMVDEVLGLTGWIVAVLLALRLMGPVGGKLFAVARGKLPLIFCIILSFFVIITFVRLGFQALMAAFQKVFSEDIVTKVNKMGGAIFGFVKGALFVSVITIALTLLPFSDKIQAVETNSYLFHHMQRLAPATLGLVKKFIPQSQDALDRIMDGLEKAASTTSEVPSESKADSVSKSKQEPSQSDDFEETTPQNQRALLISKKNKLNE